MKIRVLTTEGNIQSAGKLGFPTYTKHDDIMDDIANDEISFMVRWGHSGGDDSSRVLNPSEAIADNCNKLLAIQTLAGTVDVPAIYTSRVPRGVKAVVRPLEHSQGSDFSIKEGPYVIPSGHYASKLVTTEKEYRVWFCGSQMFCAKRVPMDTSENREELNPCRSKWGYAWQESVFPVLAKQTQKARKALSLDLGAADVLWHEEDRKYYFLELNTACALDHGRVLSFFKASIPLAINEKYATVNQSNPTRH